MPRLAYFALAAVACVACVSAMSFDDFTATFQKKYDAAETEARRTTFLANAQRIADHNARGESYTLGFTEFADMTFEEFKRDRLMATAPQHCSATAGTKGTYRIPENAAARPEMIDWRDFGVVSPVEDQGSCGSCWTFSTTGAMESHYALKHREMRQFSQQQLVDCAQAFDNHGCEGGLPSHAFEYIAHAGGLELLSSYPYTGKDGHCAFNASRAVGKCLRSVNITAGDEEELTDAIGRVGPVSVAYQVASDFHLYKSGVYHSKECKNGPMDVNHAVLAVGYSHDHMSDMPFYIIKNSWGTSFGMDGYFWILRGQNECGISNCNSYPEM